jgi:putative Mg2+ transporter-C (MgtC) family protein
MNDLGISLFELHLSWIGILGRMTIAACLGGLIGLDRELKERPAGIKTHILVSLAASLFAITAIEALHHPSLNSNTSQMDPLRVIEAVTAGVEFLAAGAINQSGGKVKGVTTGAALWTAGAVGLCVGLGFWHIALAATAITLFVLLLQNLFEHKKDDI